MKPYSLCTYEAEGDGTKQREGNVTTKVGLRHGQKPRNASGHQKLPEARSRPSSEERGPADTLISAQ